MDQVVANPDTAEALRLIAAGFDALDAAGVIPVNSRDALECIREIEKARRRADFAADAVDDHGFYGPDGHANAKVMVRHVGRLSHGEAADRARSMKVCRAMPTLAAKARSGELPTDHVRLLGRVFANPRVAAAMQKQEQWFLEKAKLSYADFERRVRDWERLHDEDGPTPKAEIQHDKRNARLFQNFDGSWEVSGQFGSMQGAGMSEIFEHYVEAEYLADWEKARAEHGEDASAHHLPRTPQQRRADALWQLFFDAASSPVGATPPKYVHNIVWDADTFDEMARRMAGAGPQPLDVDTFRCETLDGVPVDPTEAIANAFVSEVRRVIVDARGVVLDLGEARSFRGDARHAVKLNSTECIWPGCHVPSSQCETDHMVEYAKEPRTCPDSGAPVCGRHNRWKQKGFQIWRDPAGYFHIYRPDGTEII
jgi:hypothetical protein